jgi:YbbR domain-containing protein
LLERKLDAAELELELDLNGLSPGVYLVQLEGRGGSRVKKLVKQ